MNSMDSKLRKMAEKDPVRMPEDVSRQLDQVLDQLPENNTVTFRPKRSLRVLAAAACLVLVLTVLLPNISPAYAEMMEKVPVIGGLIRVVTIRNYFDQQGDHEISLEVPKVENEIADAINKDADELAEILIREFYHELDLSGDHGHGAIRMDYKTVTDTDSWFTLKLDITKIRASSYSYSKYYHIDKVSGKIVTLGDLFRDETYQRILEEKIKEQMNARMEADPEAVYWTGKYQKSKDLVHVAENQNFYWNEDGNLVIVFDEYEVAPGSMGCPEFEISDIEDILKPEYR